MIASEPAQFHFEHCKVNERLLVGRRRRQYRLSGSQAITLQIQKNNLFPIKLNTPVDKIVRDENTGLFAINEEKLVNTLLLLELLLQLQITFIPLLDHNNIQLLQRMPMGQVWNSLLLWHCLVAKESHYEGEFMQQMPSSINFPYPFSCQDHRPYSDTRGALMCWIEGNVNLHF